ncbi:hypothetical protein EYF80_017070 [Liparis tanakae]|uniref:Uncharacterized protein n=1 Tax=Liparis tanakae TaxID=230148 RepID=A0A4Z2I3Y0_9TELE|nr:hypothetical protein EYF80_017070 [Liparis tanakae]
MNKGNTENETRPPVAALMAARGTVAVFPVSLSVTERPVMAPSSGGSPDGSHDARRPPRHFPTHTVLDLKRLGSYPQIRYHQQRRPRSSRRVGPALQPGQVDQYLCVEGGSAGPVPQGPGVTAPPRPPQQAGLQPGEREAQLGLQSDGVLDQPAPVTQAGQAGLLREGRQPANQILQVGGRLVPHVGLQLGTGEVRVVMASCPPGDLNLISSSNLSQLLLEAGPGVEAGVPIGQEERVDDAQVGHGSAPRHGLVEQGANRVLRLRKLLLRGEQLAHDESLLLRYDTHKRIDLIVTFDL